MSYFYKTESPKVLAAVRAWDEKKAAWDDQRKKLGEAFGAAASPMYSGSRNYVGGIKLSASEALAAMSFPADTLRPDNHRLTMHMAGNAVPPLAGQRVIEALLKAA